MGHTFNGLEIIQSTIIGSFKVHNSQISSFIGHGLNFESNIFEPDTSEYAYIMDNYINISDTQIEDLTINNCNFILNDEFNYGAIYLSYSAIDRLKLFNTIFTTLDFDNLSISKSVLVDSIDIIEFINVNSFDFPSGNTNFSWKYLLGNKLCILKNGYPYKAENDYELSFGILYDELISTYNKFYKMYKIRGDVISANECYIEMKDLETSRYKFIHKRDNTVNDLYRFILNRFLKKFCDYGTNPVKSLIISLYVVIAFACFYFFFSSEWDRINRTFLVNKYRNFMKYFVSEQNLEDFYTDEHREEFLSYETFKIEMERNAIRTPFFFRLLGKPLYNLSLIHHNFNKWLYRKSEILSGKWEDLKPARKMYVGTVMACSIMFYFIYLVLLRSFNSLFLSINTFSTLGFGDIPVKGISRYVAILEGFLGWFLLSIFSVSLISQILQN